MVTIQLQGIGKVNAVKSSTLKVGDVLMWNYGSTSKLVKILKKSEKSTLWQTKVNNKLYERRLLNSRLVAKVNK